MTNRNIEHKNDWATPDSIFHFIGESIFPGFQKEDFFDPCPFMHDISVFDGLNIEWGV